MIAAVPADFTGNRHALRHSGPMIAVMDRSLRSSVRTFAGITADAAMCGIAGVIYTDPHRPADRSVLRQMGNVIAHRGPDGEGLFQSRNMGFVHRRLAIIDLEGGDQPIGNEDDSIQIIFNGEIYNFPELREQLISRGHVFRTQSDTEVIVHLYEEHGEYCVRHLRGMFAFALWDEPNRRVLLARDHVGQKPLYVYRDQEKILFASELKAILAHSNVDRSIEPAAIADYLAFGMVTGRRSIFKRIQRLQAAHTLTIENGRCQEPRRYWQLSFSDEETASVEQWRERGADAIRDSVRSHLIADVPVGAFLSGGLDSSLVVATVADSVQSPVRTFSIGFEEKKYSELPFASEVARHCGTVHTEEIVTPEAVRDLDDLIRFYDEPFADASAIPSMAVARMASQHVKVVLTGDGGDEGFGGYARYSHDLREAAIRNLLPRWICRHVLRPLATVWPKSDWLPRPLRLKTLLQNLSTSPAAAYANTLSACHVDVRNQLMNPAFASQMQDHRPESAVEQAYSFGARDTLSGMLAADTDILLPDDFLTKVDRASMAFGLEVRPPLLDIRLLELAARMPSSMKNRGGTGKWILKQIYEPKLPPGLVHRRKQGFDLPIAEWIRGPLQSQFEDVVLQESATIADIVDVTKVRRIYDRHCRRTGQHAQILWSLLVLGRWLDVWGSAQTETYGGVPNDSCGTPVG